MSKAARKGPASVVIRKSHLSDAKAVFAAANCGPIREEEVDADRVRLVLRLDKEAQIRFSRALMTLPPECFGQFGVAGLSAAQAIDMFRDKTPDQAREILLRSIKAKRDVGTAT